MGSPVPIPFFDPIIRGPSDEYKNRGEPENDPLQYHVSKEWGEHFAFQSIGINKSPQAIQIFAQDGVGASIAAFDLTDGVRGAGLYLVMYYARIARPGGVSSSLQFTVDWPDTSNPSFSDSAITGNLTTSVGSRFWMVQADGSPIRAAFTYASAGAPTMLYNARVTLLSLQGLAT